MSIMTVERTSLIVEVDGVKSRVWEGRVDGKPVHLLVSNLMMPPDVGADFLSDALGCAECDEGEFDKQELAYDGGCVDPNCGEKAHAHQRQPPREQDAGLVFQGVAGQVGIRLYADGRLVVETEETVGVFPPLLTREIALAIALLKLADPNLGAEQAAFGEQVRQSFVDHMLGEKFSVQAESDGGRNSRVSPIFQGVQAQRYHTQPCELAAAWLWEAANTSAASHALQEARMVPSWDPARSLLGRLLSTRIDGQGIAPSTRDWLVASTVAQWLGTARGAQFMRQLQQACSS